MHAEMHAKIHATYEERGISNRAKCSAHSTEMRVKMHAEMQFRANSLFLSLSLLFSSTEWERQKFHRAAKWGGVIPRGVVSPPPPSTVASELSRNTW